MNTIKKIFSFFLGFKGRIGRLHYFIFLILYTLISLFVINFSITILKHTIPNILQRSNAIEILFTLLIIISIQILIFRIKYSHIIRRIHDYNKQDSESSLFLAICLSDFIFVFIYIIETFSYYSMKELYYLATLVLSLISIISMFILVFIKGDQGNNKFGPKPILFWKKDNIEIKKDS